MTKFLTTTAALLLLAGSAGAALAQGHEDNHDNKKPGAMTGPAMSGPSMKGPAMQGPAMKGAAMQGPSMRGDDHGGMAMAHADWHNGGHIQKSDWGRGQKIDYRQHHLKAPPHGYEWRQVDNNYVLAAAATGLIASVILASH
jgi:pentapeptide MXKDX repeat protein